LDDRGSKRLNMEYIKTTVKKHIRAVYILAALGIIIVITVFALSFVKESKIFQTSQIKFPKGLIALNIGKSTYAPNEKVEFEMGSLDSKGNTICHSNLELMVTSPGGQKTYLTTKDGMIANSTTCSEDNNVTNDPDYRASFVQLTIISL
jgi:hypothetical protein